MTIGIFGGSFNPIHLGHTQLAKYIVDHTSLDEVWLMVSPSNPLKEAHSLIDEQTRYELAQLATAKIPRVTACDFEFALPRPSYTIQTLQALQKAWPQHQFALIIGTDNMAIFHRWLDYETILRDFPIFVYPRQGDDLAALIERYPTMHIISGAPLFPVSSTRIREALAQGDNTFLSRWLHPDVLKALT